MGLRSVKQGHRFLDSGEFLVRRERDCFLAFSQAGEQDSSKQSVHRGSWAFKSQPKTSAWHFRVMLCHQGMRSAYLKRKRPQGLQAGIVGWDGGRFSLCHSGCGLSIELSLACP